MKKTEYFSHQLAYNQFQHGINEVEQLRDNFIESNKIVKIIEEDIKITAVAGNQTNFTIKLSYYSE